MLGEGLTTGAPVQFMEFDESRYDRPRRRKRAGIVALLAVVVTLIVLVA